MKLKVTSIQMSNLKLENSNIDFSLLETVANSALSIYGPTMCYYLFGRGIIIESDYYKINNPNILINNGYVILQVDNPTFWEERKRKY